MDGGQDWGEWVKRSPSEWRAFVFYQSGYPGKLSRTPAIC